MSSERTAGNVATCVLIRRNPTRFTRIVFSGRAYLRARRSLEIYDVAVSRNGNVIW